MIIYLFIGLISLAMLGVLLVSIMPLIRFKLQDKDTNTAQLDEEIDYSHPVLLVEKGGRIKYQSSGISYLLDQKQGQEFDINLLAKKANNKDFYKIFIQPGRYNFQLDGEMYAIYSYQTSDGMLVSFIKDKDQITRRVGEDEIHELSLKILEKISNNEELDQIIQILFEEIQNRLPTDYVEIAIWDDEKEEIISYPFHKFGNIDSQEFPKRYYVNECFAGQVIEKKEKIFLDDLKAAHIPMSAETLELNLHELAGIPLWINNALAGVIVLGNIETSGISKKVQELEPGFMNQISIGLYNAWKNHEVKRKSLELSGLAKLSYSFSKIQEPQELFKNIINSFENLLPIDIFGFIIFEEQTNILEAKKPFKGLPDPIVDIIRINIDSDSVAGNILFSQDILIVENAMDNRQWSDLGLSHLASAASIREAVLIPLSPGSEPMGYILAANHHNGATIFSQDEMHLLMIVANQTAPLIENLYLLIQSRLRTQRAETLRRISSLASSNATLSEVLAFSINELSLLLHADVGGIFLVDQASMKLEWKPESNYGYWQLDLSEGELSLSSSDFLGTVTHLKEPLLIGKFDETKPIPNFYQNIVDRCDLQSAIVVPMIVKNQGIGEIWFGSHTLSFFDQGDIQLILSAANQLAYVVDQANLSLRTIEAINEKMEQDKLIDELKKINQFSQKITSLRPELILKELLAVLIEFIPAADAGWIGLWNEFDQSVKPEHIYNYSESLLEIQFVRPSLPVEICEHQKTLMLNDMDFPVNYRLTETEAVLYLRATQNQIPCACLQAPLISSNQCIGVLILEVFNKEKAFSDEDESITLSLLQQANLALANADLFLTTEKQSERLKILSDLSKTISASLNRQELQNSLLIKLRQLIDYQTATLWEKEKNQLRVIATDGFTDKEDRTGLQVQIDDSLLFQEMFNTKKSVLISDIREDIRFPSLMEIENLSWLGIPLISKTEVIGVIALEKREKNYYNEELVQLAEAFASQAAIALDNASLYQDSLRRGSELDERTQKLTWLNQFSSEVNRSLDISHITKLTADYVLNIINCEMISIFLLSGNGDVKLSFQKPALEHFPNLNVNQQPLFEKLIQSRGTSHIQDIAEENEIDDSLQHYFSQRGTKSVLLIPLQSSDKVFGWIALESPTSRRFLHDETELAMTLANQASMAINNAYLLSETVELKENLEESVDERTKELVLEHRNTEMLLKISNELSGSMDIDQILDSTLKMINYSMNVSGSLVYVLEGEKTFQAIHQPTNDETVIPLDSVETYFNKVFAEKNSILVENFSKENPTIPFSSWMFIPLKFGESILGILSIFHESPDFFTNRDLELGEAIAGQISMALNNTEIFKLVRDQSENLGSMLRDQEVEASRSQAILEAVADGVLVTGVQSEIMLLNKSANNILKIEENAIDHSLRGLQTYYGDKINHWISMIYDWTNQPSKIKSDAVISEKINLSENQVISVHLSPVIWRNDFLGTVSVFRDISVEVQIDQLKTDFISNISHELRTPMTSIKGYVEVLLMGASGMINEQQKRFLEIIQSNTNRLKSLVDDILDVSRIETGNIVLRPESFDLLSKINNIVEIHKNSAMFDSKQISYQINPIGKIPSIMADPERIEQVLLNILNNARIYSYDESVITISLESLGEFINIEVADLGVGIARDEQEHIFERFFRGKNAVNVNSAGTGIGLSIARTLIEMHGGNIKMESSGIPGEGSTFTIMLPIKLEKVNA
ncbi:MAG: GAF domain-containing protein [Anaerolineaceae bacterium]|nr:GAF domain-containing protein [Anaerolineaceae bacterium]